MRPRRRVLPRVDAGFTLLELIVATGVLGVVLGAALYLGHFAFREAVAGMAQDSALESCVALVDRLQDDLEQMIVVPRKGEHPAIVFDADHQRMVFLTPGHTSRVGTLARADLDPGAPLRILRSPLDLGELTVGVQPVIYTLAARPHGFYSPVRNGELMGAVLLSQWSLRTTTSTTATDFSTSMVHTLAAQSRPQTTAPVALAPVDTAPRLLDPGREREIDAAMIDAVMPPDLPARAPSPDSDAPGQTFPGGPAGDADLATAAARASGSTTASATQAAVSAPDSPSTAVSAADLPSTSGTTDASAPTPGAAVRTVKLDPNPPVLIVQFTAVDREGRVALRRELRWLLDRPSLARSYEDRFQVPRWVYTR